MVSDSQGSRTDRWVMDLGQTWNQSWDQCFSVLDDLATFMQKERKLMMFFNSDVIFWDKLYSLLCQSVTPEGSRLCLITMATLASSVRVSLEFPNYFWVFCDLLIVILWRKPCQPMFSSQCTSPYFSFVHVGLEDLLLWYKCWFGPNDPYEASLVLAGLGYVQTNNWVAWISKYQTNVCLNFILCDALIHYAISSIQKDFEKDKEWKQFITIWCSVGPLVIV